MLSLTKRILSSLLYADMFQYPMTRREILRFLPTEKRISKQTVQRGLHTLVKTGAVASIVPFVVVKKHTLHIGIHAERLLFSQTKWKKAYAVARFLRFVPTILYVGVTGSLAMNNADKGDDIDLCIVTAKNTVWITRLVSTILVEFVAKRRRPSTKHIQDTICLNMFLSEEALQTKKEEQDMYIAHELLQMVPLWERKGIEKKLLFMNSWVKQYYYHAYMERLTLRVPKISRMIFWEKIAQKGEKIARYVQLQYMKGRRTTETVTDSVIRFHPVDMRHIVLGKLKRLYKENNIPLDKTL